MIFLLQSKKVLVYLGRSTEHWILGLFLKNWFEHDGVRETATVLRELVFGWLNLISHHIVTCLKTKLRNLVLVGVYFHGLECFAELMNFLR